MRLIIATLAVAVLSGCKASGLGDPPLVDLANRLYLDGSWNWVDSMVYSNYRPATDTRVHRGVYVITGTASLEAVDSTDVETYAMTATAEIMHLDSAGTEEVQNWVVMDIQFDDTVLVRNDSILRLSVEPIPPEAGATTNAIRWIFDSDQLWCTNWLKDSLPAGNGDNCSTTTTWTRDGAAPSPASRR